MLTSEEIIQKINEATVIASKTPNEPEKKLRELVSPIWSQFMNERGLNLSFNMHDEVILANGRADTVFNRLILEYKKPYEIDENNEKNWKLIAQIKTYILDLSKKERWSKNRLLGVAFDGDHFLYLKYSRGWLIDEPIPLTPQSLEIFFAYLEKLTSKAALIPENLIRDFAVGEESKNLVASDCVKAFYNEIHHHAESGTTKERVFFEQWKIQFAEVHGTLEENKIDKEVLFNSYGFSKKEQENFDVLAFFFSLDSYYALLMKLLSYQVVGYYTLSKLTGLPLHDWEQLTSDNLRLKCAELEEGGIFREIGIRNFLEGDLFSWYVQSWSDTISKTIKNIVQHLNNYDPETMEIAPDETRDILKKLYQHLIPKNIRHDLGEYYTPDWLADRCLNQLNYNGDPSIRILDPACGSGTFPILAIKRIRKFAREHDIEDQETLKNILKNVYGFDLNPLAVISARTNYILAISDLLKSKSGDITIPIYLCDSINPPKAVIENEDTLFPEKKPYVVHTSVGNFNLPTTLIDKQQIQQITLLLEDSVRSNLTNDDFMSKVKDGLSLSDADFEDSRKYLIDTYEKLTSLDKKKINGIWARIIKNAFAPMMVGKFDLVVGNPPWVNWEALPQVYRDDTKHLWQKYGLFTLKGQAVLLGGGKKDISMLMTYVAVDKYLRDQGKLCFVITQSLFKTEGAGDGFRRFKLGESGADFNVIQLDDMVELQPFEETANRTAVFLLEKNRKQKYPVPYLVWKKSIRGAFAFDISFEDVLTRTKRISYIAQPISTTTSPWISGKPKALKAIQKAIGVSDYTAHAGAFNGGLSGVYWIRVILDNEGVVKFENLNKSGKNKVAYFKGEVEERFVYPFLAWGDMSKWIAKPIFSIIMSQDPVKRIGFDEHWLKKNYPKTFSYFENYESGLRERAALKRFYKSGAPFYSMFDVGEYTFSPYKVCWQSMGSKMKSVVIANSNLGGLLQKAKNIIPQHTITFISLNDEQEAHYICALVNSSVTYFIASAYSMGKSFGGPHLMKYVKIPKYDGANPIHKNLSMLSKECHIKTEKGINVSDLEEQIDDLASQLWNIDKDEMEEIQENISELN